MQFKTLNPDLVRLLTQDDEDILTPRAAKRNFAIATTACTQCGGDMKSSLNPAHIFTPNEPLARVLAECEDCGFTYDPHNGLVVAMGKMIQQPS